MKKKKLLKILISTAVLCAVGCGSDTKETVTEVEAEEPEEVTAKIKSVSEYTGPIYEEDVEIKHIAGTTYEGYIMFVHNPEDVTVQVNPYLGTSADAPTLDKYIEVYKAVGGTNAGGFEDLNNRGNGSIPQGLVIHNGELLYGNPGQFYKDVICINGENRLEVIDCTAQECLDWGVKEALVFGPELIKDYQNVFDPSTAGLQVLNPRTAIGQTSDGTFIFVILDGRSPSSFGAKYSDVVEIFQSLDTVNAANLDGGNSTALFYDGDYVNNTVSMYGSRFLPTVFLIKEGKN